jgi:predicted DNA-binding transcriptional regulator AlpA
MKTSELNPATLPDYLTPKELAVKIGMSHKFVVCQTQARRVPGQVKIGRLWRYRRVEVEKRLLSGEFLLKKEPHG